MTLLAEASTGSAKVLPADQEVRVLRPLRITEVMEMRRLYEQEFKSISQISQIMDRSLGSVHRALRSVDVQMRPVGNNLRAHPNALSHREIETAVRLYASGMTVNEVAAEMGLTWGQARHRLLQAGPLRSRSEALRASPNMRRLPEDLADEVVRRYQAGGTCKTVGVALGISPSSVSEVLARRGVSARPRRGGSSKKVVALAKPSESQATYLGFVASAPLAAVLRSQITWDRFTYVEGLTAEEVCARAGIASRQLNAWENGQRTTRFDTADRVISNMDRLWFDVYDPQAHRPGLFADRQHDDVLVWVDAVDKAAELWTGSPAFGLQPQRMSVAA